MDMKLAPVSNSIYARNVIRHFKELKYFVTNHLDIAKTLPIWYTISFFLR